MDEQDYKSYRDQAADIFKRGIEDRRVISEALVLIARYVVSHAPAGNNVHRPLAHLLPSLEDMHQRANSTQEEFTSLMSLTPLLDESVAEDKSETPAENKLEATPAEVAPVDDTPQFDTVPYGLKELTAEPSMEPPAKLTSEPDDVNDEDAPDYDMDEEDSGAGSNKSVI